MKITNFLVIFFTLLLFLQRFGLSNNMLMITSSNVTCIERERQSLLTIKHNLTDPSNLLSTWSGVECCKWRGVGCDSRNGHVVKLDLRAQVSLLGSNNDKWLEGELSPSLKNLNYLRYLDLSMNYFSGNIPEYLGSFQHLEYLNLSESFFGGGVVPHHLGNLSRLQYLDLSTDRSNFILDDLGWVSSLSSLRYLGLSGITTPNHTDWFHPITMLPSLLTLNLAYCDITNIPSVKFINFTSLHSLDLSWNHINSTFPVWLSNLTGLMHLNLQGNHIDWFHPISMLPSLLTLNLAECNIQNIPSVKFINFTSLHSLDLSWNNINSTFPVWLSNLTGLMHLQLSLNSFSGPIPQSIGLLFRLEDLYLQENQLSGNIPMSLWQLSKLKNLDLSYNSFETLIPDQLCNLSSLEDLYLGYNQLSGNIPMSVGQLSELKNLDLSRNQLSGNIPMSVGQLSKLKNLDLSFNSLVGVLSETHFIKLKNLNNLVLVGNSLVLNLSSRWIPPFQLQIFDASSCNIGPHFPNWLQTQTHIQILLLFNSSIRDTIPEWFENIMSNIRYLDLSNNQISGKLPRIDFDSNKYSETVSFRYDDGTLKMNSNKFEGSLATFPSNVRILDLSDNLLSGHIPQTDGRMNPALEVVNLSKNRFNGSIPVHLCKLPSISVLDLSQNKFSGRLPSCLGNLTYLQVMDVSNNTITGVVPSSLGFLTFLMSLHLRNNRFKGNLPLPLHNLRGLVTLDLGNNCLTGRIPFWIGESLLDLRILNLQSNKFTGKIPLQLCQLSALQHLNLAHNNISGTIPRCFSNLSGMIINSDDFGYSMGGEYEENILAYIKGIQLVYTTTLKFLTTLDISSNNITGEIPDVLMNLVGLKNLNLSRNQLKGQIPKMIGNLSQIESLDLSMNMLSGRIPQSLTSLNFLSYLNLSFNNLSGAIPVGNQLQTLGDPYIYEGNDRLCGPQVSRSCIGNNSSQNHVVEDEVQDNDEGLWFYFGMGPGFVVGLMGLLGSLHFIRWWRVVYFKMLENVYGWLTVSVLVNLARLKRKFS